MGISGSSTAKLSGGHIVYQKQNYSWPLNAFRLHLSTGWNLLVRFPLLKRHLSKHSSKRAMGSCEQSMLYPKPLPKLTLMHTDPELQSPVWSMISRKSTKPCRFLILRIMPLQRLMLNWYPRRPSTRNLSQNPMPKLQKFKLSWTNGRKCVHLLMARWSLRKLTMNGLQKLKLIKHRNIKNILKPKNEIRKNEKRWVWITNFIWLYRSL